MAKSAAARKKPAAAVKKTSGKGQADIMVGPSWRSWLDHLEKTGPTWLWACTTLCHVLCCRVTEVLKLQRGDFDMEAGFVYVGPLKRRGEMRKPLSKAAQAILAKWIENGGATQQRTRRCGARGLTTIHDKWYFPSSEESEAYLFPSHRSDASLKRANKAIQDFLGGCKRIYSGRGGVLCGRVLISR